MQYDLKKSGMRIQSLRVENGYTQEKLAEELNIDRSYYGRIEAGKKGCSVDLFVRLSDLFNVSLDYLILGRYLEAQPAELDNEPLKRDIEKLISHLEQFKATI